MKNLAPSIKIARESDAADIAYINAISWQKAYRGIIPDQILDSISIDKWAIGCKSKLKNKAIILVIRQENKIVGFAQISDINLSSHSSKKGEINSIYLHPNVWGNGLGGKLCMASVDKLRQLGVQEIYLWVLSQNVRARQFYESVGFKASGVSRVCNMFPHLALMKYNIICNANI